LFEKIPAGIPNFGACTAGYVFDTHWSVRKLAVLLPENHIAQTIDIPKMYVYNKQVICAFKIYTAIYILLHHENWRKGQIFIF
jgi:hypothetical protein